MLLVKEPYAIFSISVSSIASGENLFIVNNGLTFFDSGVSVNEKFRLDDFFDLSIKLLSLLTSVTEQLKPSLDSLYIRISLNLFGVASNLANCC